MWITYWFGIEDEDSELCGEEFLVTLKNATERDILVYARDLFPNEKLTCYGRVSETEAEMMGLDTY